MLELKNLLWPANCVPTKIYMIISILSVLILITAYSSMSKKIVEHDSDTDKKAAMINKLYVCVLFSFVITVVLNSYIFNMICGADGNNNGRQVVSGLAGLAIIPVVTLLVFTLVTLLFFGQQTFNLVPWASKYQPSQPYQPVPVPLPVFPSDPNQPPM
jgi:ABC-type xylose transport system permease subunit